jgi:cobalt-zinc-cadmium efflux system membrane fusion protein
MTWTKRKGAVWVLAVLWLVFGCGTKSEPEAVSNEPTTQSGDGTEQITLTPESQKLAEIVIEETGHRALKRTMQFPGTIQTNENRLAHVGPRTAGRIIEVAAGLGTRVEPGEKLAMIDSPDLGRAQSEFLTAQAKFMVSEKAYERARTLLDGKVIGTGEFQRREGDYFTAKTEAHAAEDRLHLMGMTKKEVKGLGAEDSTRSQVAITAPFRGTIIERHTTLGEMVDPATTLFTIADLTTLWGIAEVPEQDIAKVSKGLFVEVSVSSYPREIFRGKITYVSETINPSSRTAKTRVDVDNSSGKLKPEMFATFKITLQETETVLTISETAVQQEGGQPVVFVSKGEGRFEKRTVQIGPEVFAGHYPVLSGLKKGEKVVTQGAFILKSETLKGLMEE